MKTNKNFIQKTIIVYFCLISSYINIFSQNIYNGKIIDATTHDALQGVYVHNITNNKYAISDSLGKFAIDISENIENTLFISHLSYVDTSFVYIQKFETKEIALQKITFTMKQVLVTASRKLQKQNNIAAGNEILTTDRIDIQPVTNIDNVLQGISNVYVNRSWGIFSKNASVTMRGLDGKDRVLILLDGVPMNKAAGGSINWHLISSENIERIEVIKGPSSAMYGNNAMNGVINLITKQPKQNIEIAANTFLASYNTLGGNLSFGGIKTIENNALSWKLNGFYRKGDGYFYTNESQRDSTDAKLFLEEYNANIKLAYEFKSNNKLEAEYSFQHDIRGGGTKIYVENGSYDSYTTNFIIMNYKGNFLKTNYTVNTFLQDEYYMKQSENFNNSGNYKLSESPQTSTDYGFLSSFSTKIDKNHELTYGCDFKEGYMSAEDIYRTSSDYIERKGKLIFGGVYIQDEWQLFRNTFAISGIRADYAQFYNGSIAVKNPTKETGFTKSFDEKYSDNAWYAISPKIAIKHIISYKSNIYMSVAKGFRPPTIDDLCSSRKINKGFKIANPKLEPEKQITYELGYGIKPFENMKIEAAIYYTRGTDFQYFVGTGDSIDTGGSELKPVMRRENISEVGVIGFEIDLTYTLLKNIDLKTNYAYNNAEIIEFNLNNHTGTTLKGKKIIETPANQAYFAVFFKNKIANLSCAYNYIGEQWADDENISIIDSYQIFDISLSRTFFEHFKLSFDIQNIANVKFIDKKGFESPGRFFVLELGFYM